MLSHTSSERGRSAVPLITNANGISPFPVKIVLKVGASTITMDPGSIKLESPQISVSAKATLDAQSPMTSVKGNGLLTLQGGLVKIN